MHALTILNHRAITSNLILAFTGSLFIAFCALVRIPTVPIPTTLQTCAIAVLALSQTPKVAFLSLLFYLIEATLGLPVLSGATANPLWFVGPAGGYLFAFPIAAYAISSLANQHSSFLRKFLAALCGDAIILFFGFLQLSHFVGPSAALTGGVLCFIPAGIFKIFMAIGFLKMRAHWLSKMSLFSS